jgi:hypothetical protein
VSIAAAQRRKHFTNTIRRQILAIGSLLKKPKTDDKDMQQFKAKVADDRKQLANLLDRRKREAYVLLPSLHKHDL